MAQLQDDGVTEGSAGGDADNRINTDEGFWDHAFGSVDEAVSRQFDKTPGGGALDVATGNAERGLAPGPTRDSATLQEQLGRISKQFDSEAGGGPVDLIAGAGTTASIPRQFDNTPGGGFVDETQKVVNRTVNRTVKNVGFDLPEWLDEVALAGVALLVVGVLLWLLRPVLEIGAALAED